MMKLNLGCGHDYRKGFLNVDVRANARADRVEDIRALPWLMSDSVEEILGRDILEHVGWREAGDVLAEWFRVLKPGGLLHLQLPDVRYLAHRYLETRDTAEFVMWMYGGQHYAENSHRSGFDQDSLRAALRTAGFSVLEMGNDGGANILCTAEKPDPNRRGE